MRKNLYALIALIIPLAVVLYVIYVNTLASPTFNYVYDIGSEKDTKYLYPAERVSVPAQEGRTYRNITSALVYFDVSLPTNFDQIAVEVKIKDALPEGGSLLLGAKRKSDQKYVYHTLYDPLLEKLNAYNYQGEETRIYAIKDNLVVDSLDQIPQGSVVASTLIDKAPAKEVHYDIHPLTVKTSLRGKHTFYVYVNDSFHLIVKKQDINWYEGSDELVIELYDSDGKLVAESDVVDDGNENKTPKIVAPIQEGRLDVPKLKEGIYRLEFEDFDGLIREMTLNTNKIVTTKLYLADWNSYVPGIEKPNLLYFKANKRGTIQFLTYHNNSIQTVEVGGNELRINAYNKPFTYDVLAQEYLISVIKNDVIVTFPGYASFSKESYFEPFKYVLVALPRNEQELRDNVDYVVTDYKPVQREGNWIAATTTFQLNETYNKEGVLAFLLKTPHLSQDQNATVPLPIDSISMEITKNGII